MCMAGSSQKSVDVSLTLVICVGKGSEGHGRRRVMDAAARACMAA
jgi:hypothetical protein